MRKSEVKTPQLDKMRSVKEDSQKLSTFIDWLTEQGMPICEKITDDRYGAEMAPITISIERLLARYFEIDLNKVEDERRSLLDELRADGR